MSQNYRGKYLPLSFPRRPGKPKGGGGQENLAESTWEGGCLGKKETNLLPHTPPFRNSDSGMKRGRPACKKGKTGNFKHGGMWGLSQKGQVKFGEQKAL